MSEHDDDFIAVVDVREGSPAFGKVLTTQPVGMKGSMPHHFEYQLPPPGQLLFANGHHHEQLLLIDSPIRCSRASRKGSRRFRLIAIRMTSPASQTVTCLSDTSAVRVPAQFLAITICRATMEGSRNLMGRAI